jgi:hypothetical protein
MATTTTSQIDPTIQPYLGYGLQQAQQMYQGGGPQYYGGQTYVAPSATTQTGLQALEARAKLGNPFKTTLGDIASKSSLAGRYGSGAMGSLQDRATGAFGQQLTNTAGQLAYQNYEAERQRQQAATMAAPQMAGADYQDIQQLLQAGQMREGYQGQQQQADIAKFNFLQNQPQQNLQNYLSLVYGNPLGRVASSTTSGTQDTSNLQNLLGLAAVGGGLYKNLGGSTGIGNITSGVSNWLNGTTWGSQNADAVINPYFNVG